MSICQCSEGGCNRRTNGCETRVMARCFREPGENGAPSFYLRHLNAGFEAGMFRLRETFELPGRILR
jgi:hypothetical protein